MYPSSSFKSGLPESHPSIAEGGRLPFPCESALSTHPVPPAIAPAPPASARMQGPWLSVPPPAALAAKPAATTDPAVAAPRLLLRFEPACSYRGNIVRRL